MTMSEKFVGAVLDAVLGLERACAEIPDVADPYSIVAGIAISKLASRGLTRDQLHQLVDVAIQSYEQTYSALHTCKKDLPS